MRQSQLNLFELVILCKMRPHMRQIYVTHVRQTDRVSFVCHSVSGVRLTLSTLRSWWWAVCISKNITQRHTYILSDIKFVLIYYFFLHYIFSSHPDSVCFDGPVWPSTNHVRRTWVSTCPVSGVQIPTICWNDWTLEKGTERQRHLELPSEQNSPLIFRWLCGSVCRVNNPPPKNWIIIHCYHTVFVLKREQICFHLCQRWMCHVMTV